MPPISKFEETLTNLARVNSKVISRELLHGIKQKMLRGMIRKNKLKLKNLLRMI